jgi:biotin carboxylase
MKVLLSNCTRNAGIIVARALARAGHEVIGADDRRMPFGIRSRHIRAQYLVPSETGHALADALLAILRRQRFDVLLPFAGVAAVAARRSEFAALAGVLVPDAAALARVVDKAALPLLCAEFGIPAPAVYARDDAVALLKNGGTSLVIKPRSSHGGGVGIRFVQTPVALAEALAAMDQSGTAAVIAENIPGGSDSDRALHLLLDRESRLVASFSLRKTAQAPPRVGITTAAVSTHETQLIERVVPMLQALHWQGPLDVEWKIDARDGQAKLIEINPRFSGAIGFPTALGINMPALCVAASAGVRLPEACPSPYPEGVRYINPGPYFGALWSRMRVDGFGATLRGIRQEWSGSVVLPVLDLGDPAPLIAKLLRGAFAPLLPRARPGTRRHGAA